MSDNSFPPRRLLLRLFLPGRGRPDGGYQQTDAQKRDGKGNEHQFSFYARRLVTDYELLPQGAR